jgi:hypothetical protein
MNEITCPICGASAPSNARYCGDCGFEMVGELMATATESPMAAPARRRAWPALLPAGLVAFGGVAASFAAGDCCGSQDSCCGWSSKDSDNVSDFCCERDTRPPNKIHDRGCGC